MVSSRLASIKAMDNRLATQPQVIVAMAMVATRITGTNSIIRVMEDGVNRLRYLKLDG